MKRSKKSKNNETKSKQQNREQLKEEGVCVCVEGGGELQVRKKNGKTKNRDQWKTKIQKTQANKRQYKSRTEGEKKREKEGGRE